MHWCPVSDLSNMLHLPVSMCWNNNRNMILHNVFAEHRHPENKVFQYLYSCTWFLYLYSGILFSSFCKSISEISCYVKDKCISISIFWNTFLSISAQPWFFPVFLLLQISTVFSYNNGIFQFCQYHNKWIADQYYNFLSVISRGTQLIHLESFLMASRYKKQCTLFHRWVGHSHETCPKQDGQPSVSTKTVEAERSTRGGRIVLPICVLMTDMHNTSPTSIICSC